MAESKYLKKVQGNGASTTLSGSVSAVATSAPLTADTAFAGEGMVIIDEGQATEEFAYATAKVGSSLTILADDRGLEGGSAQAHASTATVKGIVTAGMWNNLITGVTNVLVNTTGALDTTKVVDLTTAQALTNKTLTSSTNNVMAKSLKSATTTVDVSAATAPSSGQVLTATGSTTATWQTPTVASADAWIAAGTFTYSSADAPTYVITVASGAASIYSVGDRVKLTDSTVKYFIITAVADTSLTLYGGTDYTLSGGAITSPYYSHSRSPLGFPLSTDKWSVIVTDTTKRTQSTPTSATWYNLGSITISIPIGIWRTSYSVIVAPYATSATAVNQFTTLSTANNSESDVGFTSAVSIQQASSGITFFRSTVYREKTLTVAAKTSYYLNAMHNSSNTEITFENALGTMYLRAVCAYV